MDSAGRRIGKKVGGALKKKWLYRSGLQIAAEIDDGGVMSRFGYSGGRNVPDFMIRNGVPYRILTDHLGSVRLVVNANTGAIVQRMDYDVFGKVTQDWVASGQAWRVPFGFAGGLYDPDTKLVRFGARDYDAEVGRWTAKDPIRFGGGDSNLYAYAGNDPVNWSDPSGLMIPGSERMAQDRLERVGMWEDLISGADWWAERYGFAIAGALSGAALGVLAVMDIIQSDPSLQMVCMGMPASSAEQAALVDLAKQAQRTGISVQEAETLMQWAKEAGLPFRNDIISSHWVGGGHIHLGPVNHIPVTR